MEVVIRRAAAKTLRRIPADRRAQILQRVRDLAAEPNNRNLDVKPLAGSNSLRLRVADYRIILSLDHSAEVLTVDVIGTRGDVYKR